MLDLYGEGWTTSVSPEDSGERGDSRFLSTSIQMSCSNLSSIPSQSNVSSGQNRLPGVEK